MNSLRVPDLVGWVLLVVVVALGLALLVMPSTAAPVAPGTRTTQTTGH